MLNVVPRRLFLTISKSTAAGPSNQQTSSFPNYTMTADCSLIELRSHVVPSYLPNYGTCSRRNASSATTTGRRFPYNVYRLAT